MESKEYKNNLMYKLALEFIDNLNITNFKLNNKDTYSNTNINYKYDEYIFNLEVSNQLMDTIRRNGLIGNNIICITKMFKYVYPDMYDIIFKKEKDFDDVLKENGYIQLNILSAPKDNGNYQYDITYGKNDTSGNLISLITVVYQFDVNHSDIHQIENDDSHTIFDDIYIQDVFYIFNSNDLYKPEHIKSDYDMLCDLLSNSLVSINDMIKKENGNVKLINSSYGRYTLRNHKINMDNNIFKDLDIHYGDGFTHIYKDIMTTLNDPNHNKGILLIHGVPGSGKSHLIKNMISDISNKAVIFLSPDMIGRLTDPDFVTFLTEEVTLFKKIDRNVILVIEEAESILKDRGEEINYNISNLLNITDGLLNNIFNIQVIVTFNTPVKKIDSALLRNHRAIGNISLRYLGNDRIEKLCNILGFGDDVIKQFKTRKGVTLSDIYSYGNKYQTIEYSPDDYDINNEIL